MSDTARICFMVERQVGIGSAAMAIEPHVRSRPNTDWSDVTYVQPGGLIERLHLPPSVGGPLVGFLQTRAALRRGPFEALFFLTHNPAVLRQGAISRTPSLLWTDVTPALLDAQADQYGHHLDASRSLRAVKEAMVRRTFQLAALCVGWSEWARRSMLSDYGVAEERTAVLPPGIDLSRWTMPERAPNGDAVRLLFVGGNFDRKGGRALLDVFRAHLRGRAELDIVTRDSIPPEEGVRVHRGLEAGSTELLSLYRNASAFVLPTHADCFSIASIEAMAMGLPVVVSDVGGISEIVEPGRTGFLLDPKDGRGLRLAIESLIAEPQAARAMGLQGRRVVEDRFDAKKTTERLFSLLASIARKRKGGATNRAPLRPGAAPTRA